MMPSPVFSPDDGGAIGSPVSTALPEPATTPLAATPPGHDANNADESGSFTFSAIAPAADASLLDASPLASSPPPQPSPFPALRSASCSPDIWSRPPASPQFFADTEADSPPASGTPSSLRRLLSAPPADDLAARGFTSPIFNQLFEEGEDAAPAPAQSSAGQCQESSTVAKASSPVREVAAETQQPASLQQAAPALRAQAPKASCAPEPTQRGGERRHRRHPVGGEHGTAYSLREMRRIATVFFVSLLTLSGFVAALLWLRTVASQVRKQVKHPDALPLGKHP